LSNGLPYVVLGYYSFADPSVEYLDFKYDRKLYNKTLRNKRRRRRLQGKDEWLEISPTEAMNSGNWRGALESLVTSDQVVRLKFKQSWQFTCEGHASNIRYTCTVTALLDGFVHKGIAFGCAKRDAKQGASKALLMSLGLINNDFLSINSTHSPDLESGATAKNAMVDDHNDPMFNNCIKAIQVIKRMKMEKAKYPESMSWRSAKDGKNRPAQKHGSAGRRLAGGGTHGGFDDDDWMPPNIERWRGMDAVTWSRGVRAKREGYFVSPKVRAAQRTARMNRQAMNQRNSHSNRGGRRPGGGQHQQQRMRQYPPAPLQAPTAQFVVQAPQMTQLVPVQAGHRALQPLRAPQYPTPAPGQPRQGSQLVALSTFGAIRTTTGQTLMPVNAPAPAGLIPVSAGMQQVQPNPAPAVTTIQPNPTSFVPIQPGQPPQPAPAPAATMVPIAAPGQAAPQGWQTLMPVPIPFAQHQAMVPVQGRPSPGQIQTQLVPMQAVQMAPMRVLASCGAGSLVPVDFGAPRGQPIQVQHLQPPQDGMLQG